MFLLHNYTGDGQKPSKTMAIKVFVTLDKTKPHTGNIKSLRLTAVRLMIAQVYELSYLLHGAESFLGS